MNPWGRRTAFVDRQQIGVEPSSAKSPCGSPFEKAQDDLLPEEGRV
jgi:hypothetical protein